MIKTLILSQGGMARELLGAAQTIVGRELSFGALCLGWDDSFEEASRKTLQAIEKLGPSDGLLILTDIYGGTPYNVAASFRRPGEIEIVSGVNLAMVVRLGCQDRETMDLDRLAEWIRKKGRGSICRAGSRGDNCKAETPPVDCADDRA